MNSEIRIVEACKGPFLPRAKSGERCEKCAYFDRLIPKGGECKRHAPAPPGAGSTSPVWPLVSNNNWCGDYARVLGTEGAE